MRGANEGGAVDLRGGPARAPRERLAAPGPLIELRLSGVRDRHWLRRLTELAPVQVRLRLCRPAPGGRRLLQVLDVEGESRDLPKVERFLGQLPHVSGVKVTKVSPTQLVVRAVGPLPSPCARVFEAGGMCTSCRLVGAAPGQAAPPWGVVVDGAAVAHRLVRGLSRRPMRGPTSGVHVRPFRPERGLSVRQFNAIDTAFRMGFFSYPRHARLGEVSRALGVGRSATNELLRRAEAKVVARELEQNRPLVAGRAY